MLVVAILVCEVAFWVLLVAGLTTRYLLHRPKLGLALLMASPATDLALLVLTAVDLQREAVATQVHALAAVYLGFAVGFGHRVVDAADRRFAHRFAGGPPLVKIQRAGPQRIAHEWSEFRRATVAWTVSCTVLGGLILLIGDLQRASALLLYLGILSVVLVIWFVTGPVPAVLTAARHNQHPKPEKGHNMTEQNPTPTPARPSQDNRWAPWWVYVVVLVGANLLRQAIMPFGTVPEWAVVAIVVTVSVILFVVITAVYRTASRQQ